MNMLSPSCHQAMTNPDSPKSPKQKYYLTDFGKTLFVNDTKCEQAKGVSEKKVNRLITEFAEALVGTCGE